MPTIPIPLAAPDPDAPLDLQTVFSTVYDRTGYDYSLDYSRSIEPALSDDDTEWARDLLSSKAPA